MRKLSVCVLAVAIMAIAAWLLTVFVPRTCAVPPDLTAKAEQIIQIRGVLETQQAAWNDGNIEGFMAHYHKSETLRFASGGDVETGWEPTLQRYLRRYPDRATMGQLGFSDLDIDVLGGSDALVFGRWTLVRAADAPTGLFTLHMKLIDGAWVIVSDHTSSGG